MYRLIVKKLLHNVRYCKFTTIDVQVRLQERTHYVYIHDHVNVVDRIAVARFCPYCYVNNIHANFGKVYSP